MPYKPFPANLMENIGFTNPTRVMVTELCQNQWALLIDWAKGLPLHTSVSWDQRVSFNTNLHNVTQDLDLTAMLAVAQIKMCRLEFYLGTQDLRWVDIYFDSAKRQDGLHRMCLGWSDETFQSLHVTIQYGAENPVDNTLVLSNDRGPAEIILGFSHKYQILWAGSRAPDPGDWMSWAVAHGSSRVIEQVIRGL